MTRNSSRCLGGSRVSSSLRHCVSREWQQPACSWSKANDTCQQSVKKKWQREFRAGFASSECRDRRRRRKADSWPAASLYCNCSTVLAARLHGVLVGEAQVSRCWGGVENLDAKSYIDMFFLLARGLSKNSDSLFFPSLLSLG